MKSSKKVRSFWDEQARVYSTDLKATTPDPLLKMLEIKALRSVVDPNKDTLEIGCGNGYNLLALRETFTERLVGVDYSEEMIVSAKKNVADGSIVFSVCDVMSDELEKLGSFPQIFTDRMLINLQSLEQQVEALKRITNLLDDDGVLALIECTQGSQELLNSMRVKVGLEPISYHWHNLYLDEKAFLEQIPSNLELVRIEKFSSLYYLISRVFNAKLTPDGERPSYLAEINKIAAQLPSVGDFGPHKLFLFKKRNV